MYYRILTPKSDIVDDKISSNLDNPTLELNKSLWRRSLKICTPNYRLNIHDIPERSQKGDIIVVRIKWHDLRSPDTLEFELEESPRDELGACLLQLRSKMKRCGCLPFLDCIVNIRREMLCCLGNPDANACFMHDRFAILTFQVLNRSSCWDAWGQATIMTNCSLSVYVHVCQTRSRLDEKLFSASAGHTVPQHSAIPTMRSSGIRSALSSIQDSSASIAKACEIIWS